MVIPPPTGESGGDIAMPGGGTLGTIIPETFGTKSSGLFSPTM
jgi:hypothetical protein